MENTASNNSNNRYKDFAQASRPQQGQTNAALNPATAYENTSAQMQKTGGHIFRRAVEQQIELGRFFGKRQERYLDFSSDIAHCQSATDLVKVQSAFLTKMAADYGLESRRLAQGFQELLSSWMAAQPMSFIPKQPAQY